MSKFLILVIYQFFFNVTVSEINFIFQVKLQKIKIYDIKHINHLVFYRWPIQSLPGTNFTYGFRDDKMKSIIKHWRNEYKWSERQELFNKFDNYKTKIEGLDLHFIHEKSQYKNVSVNLPLKMHKL